MHGRVGGFEEVALGVEDGARLLARRAGVEVHEGPAVDLGLQDREVGAHGGDVEGEGHPSRLRRVGWWRIVQGRKEESTCLLGK